MLFPDQYNTERYYTGQSYLPDRCPICGSFGGDCPDAAPVPMPYPAIDVDADSYQGSGPLRLYTVTVFGFTSTMQLDDIDAARYGDAAALIP